VDRFCRLGVTHIVVTKMHIGRRQRTIGISANALAEEPVQTVDFTSGYQPIDIAGYLQGIETQDETAAEHLDRLWDNLETECRQPSNTLILDFGSPHPRTWRVFKNDQLPEFDVAASVRGTHRLAFTVTLNCLP
jgi:hypothetical protein